MPKAIIQDDFSLFVDAFPRRLVALVQKLDTDHLIEVVMDLGRPAYAVFSDGQKTLGRQEVTHAELNEVVTNLGEFGEDNRAGIERTLHRFSAIRNRQGEIIGMTCRVGRSVRGAALIIRDLIESGQSVLLLGRPGVGKTTILRETARILSDDAGKRVIVVDTSNEIAGDGDIPHPGIGSARRMQVPQPERQHQVMIEAVENHMPEVIVIDEMGTGLETDAARTIAERGVQLIATAHGNTLENLMANPTLNDLVGGIQAVTLGDDEARRRGSQKTILERKAPATFDILVEIRQRGEMVVHADVGHSVDLLLLGRTPSTEHRQLDGKGKLKKESSDYDLPVDSFARAEAVEAVVIPTDILRVHQIGLTQRHISQAAKNLGLPIAYVDEPQDADILLTLKSFYKRRGKAIRAAESSGVPLYVVRTNTRAQIETVLLNFVQMQRPVLV